MIADDLSKAQLCEDEAGRIHAVGLRFGYCVYEQSNAGGATKVTFRDGLTWRYVDQSPVDNEAPAIECLQNGLILVALTQGGVVRLYRQERDSSKII